VQSRRKEEKENTRKEKIAAWQEASFGNSALSFLAGNAAEIQSRRGLN